MCAFICEGHVLLYYLRNIGIICVVKLYVIEFFYFFMSALVTVACFAWTVSCCGYRPDSPVIIEVFQQMPHLHKTWNSVVFFWVACHVGLFNNLSINATADKALCMEIL